MDFRAVGFRSPTIIGWPKTAVRLMLEHDPDPAEPKFNQSGQPCSSHTDHLRELPMSPEAVAHSDHRVGMTEPGAAILSGKHVACRITCEPDAGAKIALDDAVALPERFRVRFSGSQREALVQLISQSPSEINSRVGRAFGALAGRRPSAGTQDRFGSGIPSPWPGGGIG